MGCSESHDSSAPQIAIDEELEYELQGPKLKESVLNNQTDDNALISVEEVTEQQFMALKPWIGALVAPTTKPAVNPAPPTMNLTLQFVNGFKVEDSRKNMFWGPTPNTLIYSAAAVGINMDTNTLKQKFMGSGNITTANGHTDDIMSLGISPDRKWVVTGSLGAQPLILVWNAQTMQIKGRTKLGRNTRVVSTIRFTKNGRYFYCSDKHNDSNVYIYDVETMTLRGTEKCGSDEVIDAETGSNNRYACATKSGLWFFEYTEGQGIKKSRGIFGSSPRNAMASVTFHQPSNTWISGSIDGSLYYWTGTSCNKTRPTHDGTVMTVAVGDDGNIYSSGMKDRQLKITSIDGQVLKNLDLPSYAKSIDAFKGRIIVATKCGRVITIDNDVKKEIMHGHSLGETWGCAVGPDGRVYTTADDNAILAFNPKTTKVESEGIINTIPGKKYKIGGASTLSLLPPNQQARGIAVNKAGHVAVGCNDGALTIRTASNLNTQIFGDKTAKQWIEVLKYSPDEKQLAVGSHDNNIYIYSVDGTTYKLRGALKGHQSFITMLDWSKDGKYMQSVCGAYELLFWNVETLKQMPGGATALRDEQWATYTCKLGWWVQGVFPPACDGSHVNGLDRTKDRKIIVTADDWGLVNLYRNPCMKGAKANSFRAHSSHVVRAIFDDTDSYLYSVGGYDKTLMVWKVSNN